MHCKQEGCNGRIDINRNIPLKTGCASNAFAHPCNICGGLHWPNGNAVVSQMELKLFYKKGRVITQ